jgi:hypothetical protein
VSFRAGARQLVVGVEERPRRTDDPPVVGGHDARDAELSAFAGQGRLEAVGVDDIGRDLGERGPHRGPDARIELGDRRAPEPPRIGVQFPHVDPALARTRQAHGSRPSPAGQEGDD